MRGEVYTGPWWVNLRERDRLEDLELDGSIRLKYVIKDCNGSMDWSDLAQNMDRCQALVKAVINLLFPKYEENFSTI